MTALPGGRHCRPCGLGHRSSFDIGGLRSSSSRGSRRGRRALRCLRGLGLRRIRQGIVLLLAGGAGLAGLGRAGQKRHLAGDQKYACQHGNQKAL